MARNIIFSICEYYHLYSRGHDKREVFLNREEYERFNLLLYLCNTTSSVNVRDILKQLNNPYTEFVQSEKLVAIGSYCLMPNHFHLLAKEIVENGISRFMQKVIGAYTTFFNLRWERAGSLFGSKFKAEHVESDQHLKYLFSYIHLNPVKLIQPNWKQEGIKNEKTAQSFLEDYHYSSYLDYLYPGSREKEVILNKKEFPEYFAKKTDFRDFINEWLTFQKLPLGPTEG